MFEYPQYGDEGEEILHFPNLWRDNRPQPLVGVDCFQPFALVNNLQNRFVWEGTGLEFRQIFSALLLGAEFAYPQSYLQVVANFLRMVHCPIDFEEECQEFPPYAGLISYPLQNPFSNPDFIPEGYLIPPFILIDADNIDEFPQNELGDIVVPTGAITLDVNWFEDISGQLPSILIKVQGSGKLSINLLNQALGGLAVVTVDNPPNLADIIVGVVTGADNIIDLNLDLISLPPETAVEHVFPVDVVGEGLHTIYIVFLPILDDALIPIRFGGGFRGVELCDFGELPDMGITDLMFDPTFRLKKLVLGEWSDVEGAETFDLAIQAIELNALKGYIGVQQILTLSIDPSYPEITWQGSAHELKHAAIEEIAANGLAIAESLRDTTDVYLPPTFTQQGFVGSALEALFIPFDPSGLEADIAAAAAAAAAAQSTADGAVTVNNTQNSRLDAIEGDIDALDARLDALEGQSLWSVHFDFLVAQHGWSGVPDWTSGVGFEIFGAVSVSRADSFLPDGRLMYMRLEMSNDDTVVRTYTVKIEGYTHESSYGRVAAGDFVHYHKIQNESVPNDLGLEFNTSSPWTLKAATFYGVGTPTISAP